MKIEEIKSKGKVLQVISLTQQAYKVPFAGKFVTPVCDDVHEMINSLNNETLKIFTIYDLGELYAAVRCTLASSKKEIKFSKLAVHPEFRKLGLATRLINYVEDWARRNNYREAHLICVKEKTGLSGFYKKLGYEVKRIAKMKNEKGKLLHTELHMFKKL